MSAPTDVHLKLAHQQFELLSESIHSSSQFLATHVCDPELRVQVTCHFQLRDGFVNLVPIVTEQPERVGCMRQTKTSADRQIQFTRGLQAPQRIIGVPL